MPELTRFLPLFAALAILGACGADDARTSGAHRKDAARVDAARLANAAADADNWMSHGRTYAEERFSPLDEINDGNVQDLGLAWYYESDSTVGTESTPNASLNASCPTT